MADLKKEIENRRTFAIISHPDAGKTTITEKFLLYGGAIQEAGMVKGTSEAKYRAEASYVAQREIGRIWADPNNAASYLQNGTDITASSTLPGGTLSIAQPAAGGAYVVTVAWQQPGEAPHSLVTSFSLAGF